MSVKEIFDTMEYGSAPESAVDALAWIVDQGGTFGHFIAGDFTEPGEGFDSRNPATGEVLATLTQGTQAAVDAAVAAARRAQPGWAGMGGHGRARVLYAIARLMQKNARLFAVLETLDNGKPVRESRDIDVPLAQRHFYYHAGMAQLMESELPGRVPVGVCGQVIPWNFPLLMLAWKIGPSLAAGCSIVVKPAKETTLTALRVAELAHQAGVPAGVFNVLPGGGKEVGEPLGMHMDISMVSFTGSTATGRLFLKYAAESNLKRIVLECGGKNPAVVMKDVDDIDAVAQHVVNGAFWNMGENCSASSRLVVHADIKDELLERIGVHMRDWKMGDPLDPEHRIGSLVSEAHFLKVRSYLEQADAENLRVAFGGGTKGESFVAPTVVDGVTAESRLFREEIFGPILSVTTFSSTEEAIALANDSVYGLAASVYTSNLNHAIRLSREIRAGVVTVNCFGEGDITTPFGGYKESGFGGRDKSVWAHDQYTEMKTIWIDVPAAAS